MPQPSLYYTDLELPQINADRSTYGEILNDYVQGLETKLKNLSDRINAAGVGSNSTLAQINRDIAQSATNISGILPDPYGGNYSTVSTWPAYNSELTALGLSPPETASEIETFFSSEDFTTFANFLNGKLDALDIIVAQAELDLSSALENTCATATILDARTAAQSSGAKELVVLSSSQLVTTITSIPTDIGGNVDESEHKAQNAGAESVLQQLINDGVLTTSFRTFSGYRVAESDLAATGSVGDYVTVLSPTFSGDSVSDAQRIEAKYTGSSSVDSTTRMVFRMPQIANKENFFDRKVGDTDFVNYKVYQIRYPYPTLNCSNPSPPYFS